MGIFIPGDFGADGAVDPSDFTRLAANFGQAGTTYSRGDFTQDGVTDIEDANSVLFYDPASGDITISGIATWIASIELESESGILVGTETTDYTENLFDVSQPNKFFRLNPAGDAVIELPGIARTGLTAEDLSNDLQIAGSILPNGPLTIALSMPSARQVPAPRPSFWPLRSRPAWASRS